MSPPVLAFKETHTKNFEPLNKNILIQRPSKEEKTAGGIILPDSMKQEKPQEGYVVAVAPDLETSIEVGNKVMFGKYSGQEVTFESKDYLLMNEADVLGKIK